MDNTNNWIVYILECNDSTFYAGITNDLDKRLKAHQKGIAARYTSQRLPVKLCYSMGGYSEGKARKREIEIKSWKREKKEKLVHGEIA